MSRNIEENVVKMRFDNQEFDQNIEQSNDTVNKFKDTLTALPQQIYIELGTGDVEVKKIGEKRHYDGEGVNGSVYSTGDVYSFIGDKPSNEVGCI